MQPLDQNPHRVVGELQHLGHPRQTAVLPQMLGQRILHVRPALQHQANETIPRHHLVHQLNALLRLHQQRRNHAREDDDVRQPENGQLPRQRARGGLGRDGFVLFTLLAQDVDEFGFGWGHGGALKIAHSRQRETVRLRPWGPHPRRPASAAELRSAGNRSDTKPGPATDRSPAAVRSPFQTGRN